MARGQVHDPQEYGLTLVGDNLISDRRTIFRGIPADPRGMNGEMLTVRELCTMAPFQVYSVEFESPCPGRDPPAPAKAPALISLVDSEDDTGAGVRPPSPPAAGPPSGPAGPPSPPVFGRPRVGQVYAAKALLVARSPSPQVCTFLYAHPPLSSPYACVCRLQAPCATARRSGLRSRAPSAARPAPTSACRLAPTCTPQAGRHAPRLPLPTSRTSFASAGA